MYAFFDGILADSEPDVVIVNVNGIGYNIHVYNCSSDGATEHKEGYVAFTC